MGSGYKPPGLFARWVNAALRQASIDLGKGKRWPEHARWVRFRIKCFNFVEAASHPIETVRWQYNKRRWRKYLKGLNAKERANVLSAFKKLDDA